MSRSLAAMDLASAARERGTVASGSPVGRVMAALVLVLVLPLASIAALLVWADLGRPVLFSQTRSGKGARPFRIVKFRTMREARGADGRPLPDAMRETPLMLIVRRLRLDEIPQLVSIVRGDMAFVGPRPLLPATVAAFGELGSARCAVHPGLTGWAQVNGNTRLTDPQKLALDLWYIENRSLRLDLRILVLTAMVIGRGERVNDHHLAQATAALRTRDTTRSGDLPS